MSDPPPVPHLTDDVSDDEDATSSKPRRSFWQERGPLVVYLLAAAAIGYSLRDPRVDRGEAALAEVQQLDQKALAAHTALLAKFDTGEVNQQDIANGLEQEILPLWTTAESRLDAVRTDGGRGEVFELLEEYVEARRTATELLVQAIREQDDSLQTESRNTWRRAESLAAKLKAAEQQTASRPPTVR